MPNASPVKDPDAPDLALSAAFAPARYVVRDSVQRERLKAYLRETQVRTGRAPYSIKGNTFTLSRRWVARLAAEEDSVRGEDEPGRRRRARARLERAAGGPVEQAATAFPAGYLPEEAFFVYTATEKEENRAVCRQKPMWPYLERSLLCGDTMTAHINMAPVWERFDGADTLVIAVLDAGFDFLHPELRGRWAVNAAEANGLPGVDDDDNGFVDDIHGWDFVDEDNDPQDYNGHGTMTSGIIAAGFENGMGLPGMLPRVKILPVRVLSTAGFGSTADIAAGIRYAVARGAHVINFSIGINSTITDATLRNAFAAARDSGVIIAAASGNNAQDADATARQPFSYGFANVYGVAAHDPYGALSGFSNFGATRIDIAAPGDHIVTTGIPPARVLHEENFEDFSGAGWTFTGSWTAAADTLGGKSLQWTAGNIATASLDTDLRGKRGGLLSFRLNMRPASTNDGLDLYVIRANDTLAIGGWSGVVDNRVIAVNLGPGDDSEFRLAFRMCVLNFRGACSSTASTTNRMLRIDDIKITYADLDPTRHDVITVSGGTSLAAPFFAGYAGLMRLTADRAGVPLTRELMLAGVRPEPALAGKVATGGRLDVAKGLAFYLDTLPRIVVSDSARTAWMRGASVAYALRVRDTAGASLPGYTFTPIGLPAGGALSPAGQFAWSSGGVEGSFAVRAKAEDGTHVLRSLTTFTVGTAIPVRPAAPDQASRLRVAGRVFLLPPAAFARGGTHTLRVELYGADGRTVRALEGPLVLPSGARMVEYKLEGLPAVGARAWLDGKALSPARE